MFWIEYRLPISHLGFAGHKKFPKLWKSLEQVLKELSSKWTVLFDLVKHILKNDSGPFPTVDEQQHIVFPDVDEQADASSKIVVYVDFTKTVPHLMKVSVSRLARRSLSLTHGFIQAFELMKIPAIQVTGAVSEKTRQENVSRFRLDRTLRVLVLSQVGLQGLNLQMANHLIFAVSSLFFNHLERYLTVPSAQDVVWSGQTEVQIIGRVHRQLQLKQVYIYMLMSEGTSDVIMSNLATLKEGLLVHFLGALRPARWYAHTDLHIQAPPHSPTTASRKTPRTRERISPSRKQSRPAYSRSTAIPKATSRTRRRRLTGRRRQTRRKFQRRRTRRSRPSRE